MPPAPALGGRLEARLESMTDVVAACKAAQAKSSLPCCRRRATYDPTKPPMRLREEPVVEVLVLDVLPHLHELAGAQVAHQHLAVLKRPAPPLRPGDVKADCMLIVGDDAVELGPEGPGCQLHGPAEQAEDRVDAAVVAGQRALARQVPDHVWGQQLAQGVGVALGEGVIAPAHERLVRVRHAPPPSITCRESMTTRRGGQDSPPGARRLSVSSLLATASRTRIRKGEWQQ